MNRSLEAKPVTHYIYAKVQRSIEHIKSVSKNRVPCLATVLVGDDPSSQIYVSKKGAVCEKLGLKHKDIHLPKSTTQEILIQTVRALNKDNDVDGILVQSPLPSQIDSSKIFELIDPKKDVDCFSPHNVGLLSQNRGTLLPCTPAGILEICKYYEIDIAGKNALVIGRSDIVGKPMALLLLHQNATVTIAHSRTKNLPALVADADIVVAALGKPHFLKADLPWKKQAYVVDVGINRQSSGKVIGDVDFENVFPKVSGLTPVPGGVGPMTIAMLMVNTVKACMIRNQIEFPAGF